MARSITPTFRIEHRVSGSRPMAMTNSGWRSRKSGPFPGYGRPTEKNLQAYIAKFNASLEPGECNAHVRDSDPEYKLIAARIVRQEDGEVVASINWTP